MRFFRRIRPLCTCRSTIPIGSGELRFTTHTRDGTTHRTRLIFTLAALFTSTRTLVRGGTAHHGTARDTRRGTTGGGVRPGTVATSSSITFSLITIISIPLGLTAAPGRLPGRMTSRTAEASSIRQPLPSIVTEEIPAMWQDPSRQSVRDEALRCNPLRAVPEQ